jgi:hypothetical protein
MTDELIGGHFEEKAFDVAGTNFNFFDPNFHENVLSNISR